MSLNIVASKSCNYAYVDFGDIIQYEIVVQNIGDVPIFQCYLIDTLPSDITFTTNSIFINNIIQPSISLNTAITLPNLLPDTSVTITYECSINGIYPFNSSFYNISNIIFSSTISGTTIANSILSNTITTYLNKALIDLSKYYTSSTGLFYPTPYRIVIQNLGNTTATNLTLFDILDGGMYIDNTSILEDNNPISGNPATGLILQNLSPNTVKTVTYNYVVTSIPPSATIETFNTINYDYIVNPILSTITATATARSYYASTSIASAYLTSSFNVYPTSATLGSTVTYTLALNNIGNTTAQFINMVDTLPSSLTFITNSLLINSSPTVFDPNISVSIPNISSGNTTTVTFNAIVNTIPLPNYILNSAYINYKSLIPSSSAYSTLLLNTQMTTLPIINPTNNLTFTQIVSKNYAMPNSQLTYSFIINNGNSYPLTNCILYDTLPNSVIFINGSVLINSSPSTSNPLGGIPLPTIAAGEIITISFNVQIL